MDCSGCRCRIASRRKLFSVFTVTERCGNESQVSRTIADDRELDRPRRRFRVTRSLGPVTTRRPAVTNNDPLNPTTLDHGRIHIPNEQDSEGADPGGPFGWQRMVGQDPNASIAIAEAARVELKRHSHGPDFTNIGPSASVPSESGPTAAVSGRINEIVGVPHRPDSLYVASADGGIWKTTDGGQTWSLKTNNVPSLATGAMAIDPAQGQTLYAGLGDPFDAQAGGVIKTVNGGRSWQRVVPLTGTYDGATKPSTATNTRDLKVSPDDPNIVLVATNAGLFRSDDAGQAFSLIQLPQIHGMPLAKSAWSLANVAPHTWLCTAQQGGGPVGQGMLYRSTDDGETWQPVALPTADVGRMTLSTGAMEKGQPARVYLLAGNASFSNPDQEDVFRSDDGGQTFYSLGVNSSSKPSNPDGDNPDLDILHGQSWYNQMIMVDPTNPDNVMIGGNLSNARSTDGGKTWSLVSNWDPADNKMPTGTYVHADMHAGAILDGDGQKKVYVGSDGGIFQTDGSVFTGAPMAAQWNASTNNGLADFLVYGAGTDNAFDTNVVAGMQDNGTVQRQGIGTAFQETLGGDGGPVVIGADPNLVLGSLYGAGYHISSLDGGKTWDFNDAETGLPGAATPFGVNYAATAGGKSFLTFEQDAAAGSDPNNPSPDPGSGRVYQTTDGKQWTSVTGSVQTTDGQTLDHIPGNIVQVGASATDPNVFGALTDDGHAYSTADGGKTWTQGQQLPLQFPQGVNEGSPFPTAMSFVPGDPTGKSFFVSLGRMQEHDGLRPNYLFKTTDGGQTYTAVSTPTLPDVPIMSMAQDPSSPNVLYVGNVLGLYKSTDGGQTFERWGRNLPIAPVTSIVASPDGQHLRIGTYGRGVFEV